MPVPRFDSATRSVRRRVVAACLLGALVPDGGAIVLPPRPHQEPPPGRPAAHPIPVLPEVQLKPGALENFRRLQAEPLPPLPALAARLGLRASRRIPVSLEVERFGAGLRQGSRSPLETLRRLADSERPNSGVARRWLDTPAELRLFVIAAREDSALVESRTRQIRAAGGDVFFYRHCEPLCDNELVGAMMATAAYVDVSTTLAATRSDYVQVEAALAAEHRRAGPTVALVPVSTVLAAMEQVQPAARPPAAASAAGTARRIAFDAIVYQARDGR